MRPLHAFAEDTAIYLFDSNDNDYCKICIADIARCCSNWKKKTFYEISMLGNRNIYLLSSTPSFFSAAAKLLYLTRVKYCGLLIEVHTDNATLSTTNSQQLCFYSGDLTKNLTGITYGAAESVKVGSLVVCYNGNSTHTFSLAPVISISECDYDGYIYGIGCDDPITVGGLLGMPSALPSKGVKC